MSNVVLLRPYVSSRTLRAMARERRKAAVAALYTDDEDRYERWRLFRLQADELDAEAFRAKRWESDCELSRRAAARILEMAAERSGR